MFTGIITQRGTVIARTRLGVSIGANERFLRRLKCGDSVAIDGACLTIVGKGGNSFSADIMQETARRTTLGDLKRGTRVNIELPVTPTSFLSGHFVQGHVDGTGTLVSVARKGSSRILKFSVPHALSKYIVEKGSIAVNGVALTVIDAGKNYFTVGIIPHTRDSTSFRSMKVGARANIEVDVLAKYLEKLV